MTLNTSECATGNRIYEKSIKTVLVKWDYLFDEVEFQSKPPKQTFTICYGKYINLRKIYVKVDGEKSFVETFIETAAAPSNFNEIHL